MQKWEHNELAEDLAECKNTCYLDVPLGSVWDDSSTQRADVLEVKPSYNRFCINIFEIKVSRSDFLSDIRSEKWKGYLPHCHRFYFAAPKGMLGKEDIPEGMGLIERNDNGWHTVIAPSAREIKITEYTLLSLIFSKQRKPFRERQRERIDNAHSKFSLQEMEKFYKELGDKLGDALRNYDEYELATQEIEYLKDRIKRAILEGLGPEYNMESWSSPEYELTDLAREISRKARGEVQEVEKEKSKAKLLTRRR